MDIGDMLHQVLDLGPELLGDGVAHRIREIQGGGPGLDDRGKNLDHVIQVAPGGVHGRKLHVGGVAAGVLHRGHRHLQHLFPGLAHLVLQMDVGGGNKGVNPGIGGLLDGLPAGVDVLGESPGQAGDLRSPDFPGHRPHRLEIPRGRKGETGLDDIHVEEFQVPGDLQFFVHVEIGAGGLFPVPQGRIEDKNFMCHMKTFLFLVEAVRAPPLRLGNLFRL